MQESEPVTSPREIVTAFIESLNNRDLKSARRLVVDDFSVKAPGASFDSAEAYFRGVTEAEQKYNGRYEIKKVFADGNDVCIVSDTVSGNPQYSGYTSLGLFRVEGQKILSARFMYESRPPAQ
jgi:limonene-1,2-epoxide hydrolase